MQTLSVQVEDSYLQQFMSFIKNSHSNVTVIKDKNLEYDAYYYERKKDLEEVIEASENGTMELLSEEEYGNEMEIFFKDLKANENL